MIDFFGISKVADGAVIQAEKLIPLSMLLLLIPIVSFITIFLFKNRKLQIRFTAILILLIAALILALAYYSYYVISNYNSEINPRLNLIYPLLMMVSSFLAYRSIRKDEEIVRSYDRLR